MSDDDRCDVCGAPYGTGRDCERCREARRKDIVVRVIIGAMFILPMLTLFASIVYGWLGGNPSSGPTPD